jgi:DNA-binding Lrp family transcriptional regulator
LTAALRARSPQKPSELAAALKVSNFIVNARLKALTTQGIVKLTGATFSRLAHLDNGKSPAVAPKPNGSMNPAAEPSSSPLGVVEERDRAVLQMIKDARGTGRTVRELAISRPEDSHGALEASVTRLRVKKLIAMDDNGRWTAA